MKELPQNSSFIEHEECYNLQAVSSCVSHQVAILVCRKGEKLT